MTLADIQLLVFNTLSTHPQISHILNSDHSLIVNCTDNSNFYINILESKRTFIHDSQEEKIVDEYFATHSDIDFAKDILGLTSTHPGFFFYFMIFMKLEEMGIIDKALFYHLNDNIVYYENELSAYIVELLGHFNINDL